MSNIGACSIDKDDELGGWWMMVGRFHCWSMVVASKVVVVTVVLVIAGFCLTFRMLENLRWGSSVWERILYTCSLNMQPVICLLIDILPID